MSASDAQVGGMGPGSAHTPRGASGCLGLTLASTLIESHAVSLWSSWWPEVSPPGPTVGSPRIAIGDPVTLNSAATLPGNSWWFVRPKPRAALCLTAPQESSLAAAQVGGDLPTARLRPGVPRRNNRWLLFPGLLPTYQCTPSLPAPTEGTWGDGAVLWPHPLPPHRAQDAQGVGFSSSSLCHCPLLTEQALHPRKTPITEPRRWLSPGAGVPQEMKRLG